jgi:hypothetical protein
VHARAVYYALLQHQQEDRCRKRITLLLLAATADMQVLLPVPMYSIMLQNFATSKYRHTLSCKHF